LVLGDPFLEDLEQSAAAEGRSFSNTCLQMFLQKGGHNGNHHPSAFGGQMQLFSGPEAPDDLLSDLQSSQLGVTFRESKHQGPHGWYPYVEGFSATYVRDALLRFDRIPRAVYDPFGGSGTTQLTAALLGVTSFFSEVDPFMSVAPGDGAILVPPAFANISPSLSLLAHRPRTVLAVKGPLRRAQQRRALDRSGPF
jgi:hypothetical protein